MWAGLPSLTPAGEQGGAQSPEPSRPQDLELSAPGPVTQLPLLYQEVSAPFVPSFLMNSKLP